MSSSHGSDPAQVVVQQGAVRVITLNRPERRNAIDIPDRGRPSPTATPGPWC